MSALPRLLIVDDEAEVRSLLRQVLASSVPAQVDVAEDASAALEMIAKGAYDVAIVDYWMPGMTGVALIGRIRHDHPSVACLLMTSFAEGTSEAKKEGIRVLLKPFRDQAMTQVIREVLAARKADPGPSTRSGGKG